MKTKIAFWIALGGALTALALRCIQMLFFFNYETGFVTDSGAFTVAYCVIGLGAALASGILCRFDRGNLGAMRHGRNWAVGVATLFTALFLFFAAAMLIYDYITYYATGGMTYYVEPLHVEADFPFAIVTAVFGLVSLVSAVCWFRGRAYPGRAGALWAVAVLWGLYYMLITFMTYSASATLEENLFTVGGGALLVFYLLAEGKLMSGIGRRKSARAIYALGIPTAVLWLTYALSNTVLIVAGRGYVTEMPYILQLVMLAHCARILALLLSFRRTNFLPAERFEGNSRRANPPKDGAEEAQ